MDSSPSSLPSPRSRDVLEQITLHMASSLDLQIVLTTITQGLVDELDGAFARISFLSRMRKISAGTPEFHSSARLVWITHKCLHDDLTLQEDRACHLIV